MKKALMLFAEGFETVEALMVVDLLRRGGVEVSMASIDENEMVTSAQGIGVQMDMVMGEGRSAYLRCCYSSRGYAGN